MSAQMLEGSVSIRSENGVLSRKGRCPVSKEMRGQWSNDEGKQQMSTPPHPPPPLRLGMDASSMVTD